MKRYDVWGCSGSLGGGGGGKVRKLGDEGAKRAGKRRGKDSVWGA